jgi:hypothetical protein
VARRFSNGKSTDVFFDPRFDDDFELAVIESFSRSPLHLHEPFAKAAALVFQGAMMAIRVVSRSAKKNVRRPRASGATNIRIITTAAKPPQILDRTIPHITQFFGRVPNLAQ